VSRLTPLAIPFVSGHTDEIDEKLLPNGVFADVSNARLPQPGGLRLRRGWRPVPMADLANGSTLTAIDLYSFGESLLALNTKVGSNQQFLLATYTQSNATRPWVLNTDSGLPPITRVSSAGNMPALSSNVNNASAALTADGVYGCVLQQSATQSVFRVFVRATDETVAYGELTNGSRVRKVVSMGSTFGLVENTGAGLDLYSLNPTGTAPAWALVGTLFAAVVTWFDVAVACDSTPTALHIADVVGAVGSYRQFTFAGVQTGATKTVAAATCLAVTLCSNDAAVEYVSQDSGTKELALTSFSATSPFTTAAGPTAVNAGQAVVDGLFCVGLSISGVAATPTSVMVASEHAAGANDLREVSYNTISSHATHAVNTRRIALGQQLFGGFMMRNALLGIGLSRRPTGFGLSGSGGSTSMYAAAATNLTAPWCYIDFGIAAQFDFFAHPPFWPAQCPTGDCLVLAPRDETPNTGVTPRTATCRALRLGSSERRPAAQVNGGLYITGGILTEWVGALNENGQLFPIINTLAGSNSTGTIANGTYQYRAVMVWEDERQNTHRSIVSGPAQLALAGANDTITATVYAAKTLRRNANLITNPRIELYRTEAGPGALFYLTNSAAVATFTDTVTIVDTMPDATLVGQAQLYTQGEVGATSGILDQAPARPSAFVAATKRRLVLGSSNTSYQWSQISFPETPIWFAEPGVSGDAAQAYFDDVEGGRITGVAALDEIVFIGTADRIYVTGGTGPNLAGAGGEFSPPVQLPADVGFFNAQSILETSEGLWFLGSINTFYLLARGTPTPELSRAVQDRLTTAVVGCGYDHVDNVAVWATASATAVVRQLDTKQWFGDTLPFTPIALHSHGGQLYAIASDGVVWAQSPTAYGDGTSGATAVALRVTTGQIGPFEMAGWGRLAVVELLGEFETAAALLAEISYDDGLTWTSLGTHTVTGLSSGQAWQRQWYPARQRGDRFRCRFTMTPTVTTTEGCRLTGSVVYYSKRSGQTRLDSAKRR